ncbi:MAG TPA: hypothetical protein VGQ47_02855, partial [Candidatus Limnocylindrales bacterium]|nr:hypothetical protein [Candidatus Limnocylindrales bacterium]
MLALLASAHPVAGAGLTVATSDGLALTLTDDGRVSGISVHDRTLGRLPGGGGFEIRTVGRGSSVLPNGGFETDRDGDGFPDGWQFSGSPRRPTVDHLVVHSGQASIRLRRDADVRSGVLTRTIGVDGETNYTVSMWMRTTDLRPTVSTTAPSTFRLRVESLSETGSVLATAEGSSYSDTSSWHRRFVGFETPRGATTARITTLIVGGSGTAWIDDIQVGRLFRAWSPVRGSVSSGPSPGVLEQRGTVPDTPLRFSATYRAAPTHIAVSGEIELTGTGSVGAQVAFTLPIDARGWRWGEYARHERKIENGRYAYVTQRGLQSTSRYPLGVLSSVYDPHRSL